VTQLHQTIDGMTRRLEPHVAHEVAQWLGMKGYLEDRETKWVRRTKDNVLWSMGIADMTAEVVAVARVPGAAPAQNVGHAGRDATAWRDMGGLSPSQLPGATQDGEPAKLQLLQEQQKPKCKLQLSLQPRPRQEPKPNHMTPVTSRRWETMHPRIQSQMVPGRQHPAPTTGSNMADGHFISRRDEWVPPPMMKDQAIASAIDRALFHQQAPARFRIVKASRNTKGAMMAITHQNTTAKMALLYCDIIITTASTVYTEVIDVEDNE